MKVLKMLMVFVTTFCLLNVQYQSGVVKVSLTNDVQAQAGQNLKAEGVYQGEEASQADGFLDQILYLVVGLICAPLIMKAKSTTPADVIVGAVAGAILLVGELAMMSKNADAVAAMELSYTIDNQGKTYDNSQLEAFEIQLKMNEELRDALKTKQMIQLAATVALIGATVVAVVIMATAMTTGVTATTTAAAATMLIPAFGIVPNPVFNPLCISAIPLLAAYWGNYMALKPSLADYAALNAQLTTMSTCLPYAAFQAYELGTDLYSKVPGVVVGSDNTWLNRIQKVAKANPQAADIANGFMKELKPNDENIQKRKQELIEYSLVNKIKAKPLLPQSHPLNDISIVDTNQNDTNEINRYMRVYESTKMSEGAIKSISINEFKKFETIYKYEDLNEYDQNTMKDILKTAANKGLDLIFPQANAGWMNILMVVGGVLMATFVLEDPILDTMFGTAGKRAIVWGVMTVIVGMGLKKTMEGIDATENNIEKIKKIIENISTLSDGEVIELGGPTGGGGTSDLGTQPIIGATNTEPVDLGIQNGGVTPCVAGTNTDGSCQSVATELQNALTYDGFDLGSGLAATSNLIGAIGDGTSATSNLSPGTISDMNSLASNQSALTESRRAVLAKLDKVRKKNGLKPFNFNKKVSDFHNKMKASLKSSLAKQGLSPKLAAAQLGITGRSSDKKVAKEEGVQNREGVAAKAGVAAIGGAALAAKRKKIDFGFGAKPRKAAAAAMQSDGANVASKEMAEYFLDDITDDKNTNIFDIISERYLRSGYVRLHPAKTKKTLNN
jgi:hypothetical protein